MKVQRGSKRRSGARSGRAMVVLSLAAAGVGAMLVGCSTSDKSDAPMVPIESNPLSELIKPKLTTVVKDGEVGVSPSIPVTATVADGKLGKVELFTPDNSLVAGAITPDGLSWQNTEPLGYNREYRLVAEAYGLGGRTSTELNFTTSVPENLTKPYLLTGDGDVVGIGQPVGVHFDEVISDRKAAENAIKVVTDPPVEGAFYWVSGSEVRWRPENYWAPNTKVSVKVEVYGKDLGGGLFGSEDVSADYSIGDAVILTADDNTKQVTVTRNGEVVMTMPTSMGKAGDETPNGTYIVAERHEKIIMDSATYGVPNTSPDGYKTPVDWATRMSYSGIFFHSAPWSVGQQGYSNVSHGCLNLSPSNALWVFNNTKRGDIAIVKNTSGGTLSGTDGLGDWNIPWSTWKAGNANQQ
ncbi:L,D-transpeptidase family protein [Antrihabitans sp. YC3-6]|uniref:L,D-transpeptidase family protein n=1 Tax=Antrihabitans stalagmiti TaxID=2799499 RepID=A0A934NVQ9_9NOCA|nr:Ig-like domain-containing protein [Antrihabitans stalagmiti]MBJ8342431.1 L,D-transpeptidase family protein [Antrihabitans stalagmiti]